MGISLDSSMKREVVVLRFSRKGRILENWGDKLNFELAQLISQKRVYHKEDVDLPPGWPVYVCIGSSIWTCTKNDIVWGTGFISENDEMRGFPRKICAVRGPLTYAKLKNLGIDCPYIFGDPAILYPLFYNPKIKKSYDIGIIPHFREYEAEPLPRIPKDIKVKVINIRGGLKEVVNDILSCHQIISSSLHGIIAAHAYGVPATWVKFSDRPMGDGFKFRDYWASMGWDEAVPMHASADVPCDELIGVSKPIKPRVDPVELINACPFAEKERKLELRSMAEERGLGLITSATQAH